MVGVDITIRGLDQAIAMVEGMAQPGNLTAIARRVFHEPGAGRQWHAAARSAAAARLQTALQPDRRPMIETFLNTVFFSGTPTGGEFGMRFMAGIITSAHAYLMDRFTTSYGTGERQVRRMKRVDSMTLFTDHATGDILEKPSPETGSEAHRAMLDRARELVREWVLSEKELDDRDQGADFDPDEVTDRVCAIVGLNTNRTLLGTRQAGQEFAIRNLPAARASLTARIEEWISAVQAGKGGDKLTREQRAHLEEFGEVSGFEGDPSEQVASARSAGLARRQALANESAPITPEEIYAWVSSVVDAWTQMVIQEFRQRFQQEINAVVRHYFKGATQGTLIP